jgi:hypothetical protein
MTLGRYLLSIEPIPAVSPADSLPDSLDFPAYFVGSTAPNNVEDGLDLLKIPRDTLRKLLDSYMRKTTPSYSLWCMAIILL